MSTLHLMQAKLTRSGWPDGLPNRRLAIPTGQPTA